MSPDLWNLYGLMYKSRKFEEAVCRIWKEGKISGEMHLGMGEEGIVAGILSQLIEGDALALDHRGTPPLIMRGVDVHLPAARVHGETRWAVRRNGRAHASLRAG